MVFCVISAFLCVFVFINFREVQQLLKWRLAILIVFYRFWEAFWTPRDPPWDTMWSQGGRRGRHLEVILLFVFQAILGSQKKRQLRESGPEK